MPRNMGPSASTIACQKKFASGCRKRFGSRLRELNSGVDSLRRAWRSAGVLLLTTVVAVLSSTPALALVCTHPDRPPGHPSSCHRHGPVERQPANHVCCGAGRDVAIPVSAFSSLPLSSLHLFRLQEIAGRSDTARRSFCFAESPSPPAAGILSSPLRV